MPGELLASSKGRLWKDLLVQIFLRRPMQESLIIPAVPEPLIVWVLSGSAVVEERPLERPWMANPVRAGDFFLTHSHRPPSALMVQGLAQSLAVHPVRAYPDADSRSQAPHGGLPAFKLHRIVAMLEARQPEDAPPLGPNDCAVSQEVEIFEHDIQRNRKAARWHLQDARALAYPRGTMILPRLLAGIPSLIARHLAARRTWLLGLLLLAVAGCAQLPPHAQRPLSLAIQDDGGIALGRITRAASPDPELSGFRLLPMPAFALEARLELVRRAERSIDVQYYLIQNDQIGRILLRALRDAAQRGVHVRILVDDLYTASTDAMLRALAAHPGVEVRLFNPFPAGRASLPTRFAAAILDFDRLTRRMHNKLFVVDNAMAVAGGRNMANEYFVGDNVANFIDIDVLIAGPLVRQLSSLFDMYWNSPFVYPIEALVPAHASDDALRAGFESMVSSTPRPAPPDSRDLLGYNPLGRDMAEAPQALDLVWAQAEAYTDPPGKVRSSTRAGEPLPESANATVLYRARTLVRAAQQEVIETTPYLIPGKEGMESMRRLRARGVRFAIVTNSLATNDETLVHAGYTRYRTDMLRLGVELHELSPTRSIESERFGIHGSPSGRLHAKSAVIDRRTVFLGSLNFDPRSDAENTELGIFIFSPVIARQVYSLIGYLQQEGAYRLRLNASDQSTEWVSPHGDDTHETILRDEPETNFWLRWQLKLFAPFVPEGLL